MGRGPGWSDPQIEQIKTMWLSGKTATEIGNSFNPKRTRNAVMGKVYRMGFAASRSPDASALAMSRGGGPKNRNTPKPKTEPLPKRKPVPRPVQALPVIVPDEGWKGGPGAPPASAYRPRVVLGSGEPLNARLVDLDNGQCHWPVAEIDGEHRFCGCRVWEGRRYCEGHAAAGMTRATTLAKATPNQLYRSVKRFA